MIKMENDVLSVEIAEHGAELTKLYKQENRYRSSLGCRTPILETSFTGVISKCGKNL